MTSPAKTSRSRALPALLAVVVYLGWVAPAAAQGEVASAQARGAQYVFVIDDSGSMSKTVRGEPAADPNRLAVFAARSTLTMLDDADEATVVRLNGPDSGDTPPPIAALAQNRAELESVLALDADIAAYDGARTPCSTALDELKTLLNDAYRPDVAQVVMFLTDGACTGPTLDPGATLKGIKSAQDQLFRFFLIRFEGRDYTAALEELADASGGMAIEASADDPSAILKPFASALSRSQGYEAYLLRPGDRRLPAHRGARRVRLLAVAPDRGAPLDFKIDALAKGEPPLVTRATTGGVHQWNEGERYRYAALDYRPGTTPVEVSITGAGRDWKIIAVPEYRIFVELEVLKGLCDAGGAPSRYVEVGQSVCVEVKLVNQQGEVLQDDVAGRASQASVLYESPSADKPKSLPANRSGRDARFLIERANLSRGDHIFRPRVALAVPGEQTKRVELVGAARSLQVSSVTVSASPPRLDLGQLRPGEDIRQATTVEGNFPATPARVVVEDRDAIPECVQFELSGTPEGQAQPIAPGQGYSLKISAAPYCGPSAFQRTIDTVLRLEFDRSAQMLSIPTLTIPVKLGLNHEVRVPKQISVTIEGGASAPIELAIGGNFQRDATFEAMLPAPEQSESWPGDDLELLFVDEDGEPLLEEGEPARATAVTFSPDDPRPLRLKLASEPCCAGGEYTTEVALVAAEGSKAPIRVPVVVEVREAGLWQCWGRTILATLAALATILLILYVVNMIRSSNFLDKKRLADGLVPLKWDIYGSTSPARSEMQRVRSTVARDLKWRDRAGAWLRANPLKFGLPGVEYYETVQLFLSPQGAHYLNLNLVDARDHYKELDAQPERGREQVFASARRSGIVFYCVPDDEGRLGAVTLEAPPDLNWPDEEHKAKVVTLKRDNLIDPAGGGPEDEPAGWQVG